MKLKFSILAGIFIWTILNSYLVFAQKVQNYSVENGSIAGVNTGRYNNRPLYINNTNTFILTRYKINTMSEGAHNLMTCQGMPFTCNL